MADLQLIDAVKTEDLTAAGELVKAGMDLNQQDEQGWTPLNWAAGKGNLEMVRLLVDHGADVFKVGRDQRTPYMIALAAGRVEVVKFLRQVEDRLGGKGSSRHERKYCKAYHLNDFRQYPGWTESKINWKEKKNNGDSQSENEKGQSLSDGDIVFLHQDYTVTQSMWHNENVIFNLVTPEWIQFCSTTLRFKPPDDMDLIVPK